MTLDLPSVTSWKSGHVEMHNEVALRINTLVERSNALADRSNMHARSLRILWRFTVVNTAFVIVTFADLIALH